MPSYEIIDRTESGFAKVHYTGIDEVGYRNLNTNEPTSQQAYAGSKQQEQYDTRITERGPSGEIKESESIPTIDRVPGGPKGPPDGSDISIISRYDIKGSIKEVADGYRFQIEPGGAEDTRDVIMDNRNRWEAYQIGVTYLFDCKGSTNGPYLTTGWSKVKDDISHGSFKKPDPIRDPHTGEIIETKWSEVDGDTIDVAYMEAENNAWAGVGCSIIRWQKYADYAIFYVGTDSLWADRANSQGWIRA